MTDYEGIVRLADHVDVLTVRYIHTAATDSDQAALVNLAGVYDGLADVTRKLAREMRHWAQAARDAEVERDEEREHRINAEEQLIDAGRHLARLTAEVEGLQAQLRGGAA